MPIEIYLGAPRHDQAVKVDERVRVAADRACQAWFWLMAATFVDLLAGGFAIPRDVILSLSPLKAGWIVSMCLLFVAAFAVRAIIEHKLLLPAVAEALDHYKRYPEDFNPPAQHEWYRLLTEAGVEEFPDEILRWLSGPHALHLAVLSATIDLNNRPHGDWAHDRAHSKLAAVAAAYAEDWRQLAKRRNQLTRAERRYAKAQKRLTYYGS
jgi:hypothetical protein